MTENPNRNVESEAYEVSDDALEDVAGGAPYMVDTPLTLADQMRRQAEKPRARTTDAGAEWFRQHMASQPSSPPEMPSRD